MPSAEEVVEATVRAADRLIVRAGSPRRVRDLLEEADRELAEKLAAEVRRTGGVARRFTGARLQQYQAQYLLVLARLEPKLIARLGESAEQAARRGQRDVVRLLRRLEAEYAGVSTPLLLEQADVLDSLAEHRRGSLMAQHAVSIRRYGEHMVREFERQIRLGLVQGETQRQIVQRLSGQRELPGVFVRQAYWARRIVRTEVAYAYNVTQDDAIAHSRQQFPDMARKIIATFDNRTAFDSVYVHGQIREVGEMFEDGKGRRYLHPPGRPNDRECLIPWRKVWPELPNTKMRRAWEVAGEGVRDLPEEQQPHGDARYAAKARLAARLRDERKRQARIKREARRVAQGR